MSRSRQGSEPRRPGDRAGRLARTPPARRRSPAAGPTGRSCTRSRLASGSAPGRSPSTSAGHAFTADGPRLIQASEGVGLRRSALGARCRRCSRGRAAHSRGRDLQRYATARGVSRAAPRPGHGGPGRPGLRSGAVRGDVRRRQGRSTCCGAKGFRLPPAPGRRRAGRARSSRRRRPDLPRPGDGLCRCETQAAGQGERGVRREPAPIPLRRERTRARRRAGGIHPARRQESQGVAQTPKGDKASILGKLAAVGVLQTMYDADVQKAFLSCWTRATTSYAGRSPKRWAWWRSAADADVGDGLLKALVAEDNDLRRAVALAMAAVAGPGDGGQPGDDARGRRRQGPRPARRAGPRSRCSASRASSRCPHRRFRRAEGHRPRGDDVPGPAHPGPRSTPCRALLKNPHLSTRQRVDAGRSGRELPLGRPSSLEAIVSGRGQPQGERRGAYRATEGARGLPGGQRAEDGGVRRRRSWATTTSTCEWPRWRRRPSCGSPRRPPCWSRRWPASCPPRSACAAAGRCVTRASRRNSCGRRSTGRCARRSTELKREAVRLWPSSSRTRPEGGGRHLLDKDAKLQREAVAVSGLLGLPGRSASGNCGRRASCRSRSGRGRRVR